MTLVLPYGPEQIGNSPLYSRSVRNSTNMPCVFDGEALDFESALMNADWNSDIRDYETPADDFSPKAPSDVSDLKRKVSLTDSTPTQPKKLRTDIVEETPLSPLQSESPPQSASSSSSSSSSSSDGNEDEASDDARTADADDDEYIPRRRGPQMWNSRQRWKDERKRVLKLSITKLAEIEDPELCMHRSVVINNTVKRLHLDIKNERQAKIRLKLQRMDFFAERFHPISAAEQFDSDTDMSKNTEKTSSRSSDTFDESSCDEIFGVSEDFLRVTIPDRRVSSPVPTNPISQSNSSSNSTVTPMDTSDETSSANRETQTTCYANSNSMSNCDTKSDSSASSQLCHRRTNASNVSNSVSNNSTNISNSSSASNSQRRLVTTSGNQCATQYRTSRDLTSDGSFPPRVPILDSVVYHSLLASLESS